MLWTLLGLAVVGLAVSLYFTAAYFSGSPPPGVPAALCRSEERSCVTILRTPYARLFGVPNAVLGVAYYAGLAAWAGLTLGGGAPAWTWQAAMAASVLTVALAPYLVWALVRQLNVWCGL